jgi:adenylate cyclase
MRPTVRTIGLIGSSWISDGRPRCSLTLAGRFEDALDCFVKAERLSPRDPLLWGFTLIHALACILSHEYETAVHLAQKTIQIPRATGHWPHTVLAAPLAHLGRIEEARAAVKAALEQKPDLSLSYLKKTVPTKHPGGLDPYLDGLRKAGLPE